MIKLSKYYEDSLAHLVSVGTNVSLINNINDFYRWSDQIYRVHANVLPRMLGAACFKLRINWV